MSDEDPRDEPVARRNRREHGGASARPDDDELARRTEQERVEAGVDDYDPDDVPPATDADPEFDVTQTEEFQEERGMFRRQESEGEAYPITEENPYPPTRYEE